MTRSARTRAALACVAVALVATATACGGDAGDDKHPEHRSFALHGRTLTVDSDNSTLEVVASDAVKAGTVEVTRWFSGSVLIGTDPHATWSLKDDRLVLRLKCAGLVADCSARHRVEVPRGVQVKVEDRDGTVRAHGFKDALDIRSTNGTVRVSDSSGPLQLASNNGSVRAEVSSRRVRATTRNGSVHLELAQVPDLVDARSANGSLGITLPRAGYRVTTAPRTGSTHVSVPRDDAARHVVTARTTNGSIKVTTAD